MPRKSIKLGKIQVPNVRSKKDIPAFEKLLKKGPITLVLVYADWCGHCTRYKENVWSPLKSMKNRTANLASVHYDQLENTSLASAKIDGYPSMLVVGKDRTPATFNGDSGITNAMPNANDLETMQKVASAPINTTVSSLNSIEEKEVPVNIGAVTNLNSLNVRTPMSQNTRLSPLLSPSDFPMESPANVNISTTTTTPSNASSTAVATPTVATPSTAIATPSTAIATPSTAVATPSTAVATPAIATPSSAVATPSTAVATPSTAVATPLSATSMQVSVPPNINSDVIETPVSTRRNKVNSQGTTPLLEGGRLYRNLSYRKRRNNKRKTSKRKN